MNTGLKVWLWIVFVINIISGVMMIPLMLIQPLLIVSLIAEVLIIVGAGLILFAQKKVGFYLMIACAAIGLVINIFGGVGVVKSIISAVSGSYTHLDVYKRQVLYMLRRLCYNSYEAYFFHNFGNMQKEIRIMPHFIESMNTSYIS